MDTKITRQRIDAHLEYDWFKYILILLATIALWIFVFQMINQSREYETIGIFAAVGEAHDGRVAQRLGNEFADDSIIRDTNIRFAPYGSQAFFEQLATVGMITSDILILPFRLMQGQSMTEDIEYTRGHALSMLVLDDYLIEKLLPNGIENTPERFFIDIDAEGRRVNRRGIRIDNLPNADNFFNFTRPPDTNAEDFSFYIAFNQRSANIGRYSRRSRDEHEQAIHAVRVLLEWMS